MANDRQSAPPAASTEPAKRFADKYESITEEMVEVVRKIQCPTATDVELHYFFGVCDRLRLDPLSGQVWLIKRRQKVTDAWGTESYQEVARPLIGIDGYRVIAVRTGEYEGQGPIEWCGDDGKWVDVWLSKEFPAAARAKVHRRAFREPLVAVALWDEYVPMIGKRGEERPMPKWSSSPAQMISKVAEALALRRAFPNDLSGVYVEEELDKVHAEGAVYSAPTKPVVDVQAVVAQQAEQTASTNRATTQAAALESTEQKAKADAALAEFQRECEAAVDHAALKAAQKHLAPYFATEKEPLSADVLRRAESVYMTNDRRLKAAPAPGADVSLADQIIGRYRAAKEPDEWAALETERKAAWDKLGKADKVAVKDASDVARLRTGAK